MYIQTFLYQGYDIWKNRKANCNRVFFSTATYSQLYRKDGENELRVASREKSSTHIKKKRVAEKALLTFFSSGPFSVFSDTGKAYGIGAKFPLKSPAINVGTRNIQEVIPIFCLPGKDYRRNPYDSI